jgi:hypothetical protein
MVSNRWQNLFNHIERDVLYTQAGFIVWRPTTGAVSVGARLRNADFRELGKAALDDQLAGPNICGLLLSMPIASAAMANPLADT